MDRKNHYRFSSLLSAAAVVAIMFSPTVCGKALSSSPPPQHPQRSTQHQQKSLQHPQRSLQHPQRSPLYRHRSPRPQQRPLRQQQWSHDDELQLSSPEPSLWSSSQKRKHQLRKSSLQILSHATSRHPTIRLGLPTKAFHDGPNSKYAATIATGNRRKKSTTAASTSQVSSTQNSSDKTTTNRTDSSTADDGLTATIKPIRCYKIKYTTRAPTTKRWSPKRKLCPKFTPPKSEGTTEPPGSSPADSGGADGDKDSTSDRPSRGGGGDMDSTRDRPSRGGQDEDGGSRDGDEDDDEDERPARKKPVPGGAVAEVTDASEAGQPAEVKSTDRVTVPDAADDETTAAATNATTGRRKTRKKPRRRRPMLPGSAESGGRMYVVISTLPPSSSRARPSDDSFDDQFR